MEKLQDELQSETYEAQHADRDLVKSILSKFGKGIAPVDLKQAGQIGNSTTNFPLSSEEEYIRLREQVRRIVSEKTDVLSGSPRDPQVRSQFRNVVLTAMRNLSISVEYEDEHRVIDRLFGDVLGYGILEKYFYDPEITEIIVRGTAVQYVKHGKRYVAQDTFDSIEQARYVIERMLAPTGRRLDLANPRVSARLPDGSRMMAHITPVAADGILASIRRFRQDITADVFVKSKSMSRDVLAFLRTAVNARQNIVIVGGTGSGKTTLLNVLAGYVPDGESIVTIEDTAELRLQHTDVRRLEGRPPNVEGKGEITLRLLVQDALRMFPDRVIVGECRGGEAFDMLQAMNTGHPGSMTTVHANSARNAIARLMSMIMMAGMDLPRDAILDMIAEAVDLIVFITRERSGRRRLDHIVEVAGPKKRSDGMTVDIELNELWQYDSESDTFRWVAKTFQREDTFRFYGWKGWAHGT